MDALEKGSKLSTLIEVWRNQDPGDTSTWVPRGLMTAEEFADWKAAADVESKAYHAGKAAEDAVPSPDYNAGLPAAYLALYRRLKEVKGELSQYKLALDAFDAFNAYRGYKALALSPLAFPCRELREALEQDAHYQELQKEEMTLTRQIEPKERDNSVVRRVRHALYDEHRKAEQNAGSKASQAVLDAHADIVRKGKAALAAKERRVRAAEKSIFAQMQAILQVG